MKKQLKMFSTRMLLVSTLVSCDKIYSELQPTTSDDYSKLDKFSNPILPRGADPWVTQKNGKYYFTYTQGSKVVLYETERISELALAKSHDAWTPPSGTSYSSNIWAPELHEINGKWYIYFSADNGSNANHRMYVIENDSANPMEGTWTWKGKVSDPTDQWAIDGTVLHYNNTMYMLWSGGNAGAPPQNIYIAKMSNPWTIEGEKVAIASPTYPWEKYGNPINEGPQVLESPTGDTFVVYSGSGYWVDNYCLGLLRLKSGGDPMNPSDWTKTANPIFSMKAESGAYGPGHNGFFKSPDGTEDWIIYHARSLPNGGNNNGRNARIQTFSWNNDGTPNLGEPLKIGQFINRPSGEKTRLLYKKENWSIAGYSSEELVNTRLADRLIDDDLSTYWITRYSTNPTQYPDHWIVVDMYQPRLVDGFAITQKNGDRKINELEILVSDDNIAWESLGVFELQNLETLTQYLPLNTAHQFRYFKLVPQTGYDSTQQPGLAEVGTYRYE
ncbi:family 43 glycosylhydrolase [Sphingobacterium sp. LRF_L2]|uniref:family 43 glycosylhydrolase n=1 Tax=Sphingobacterium sp. LRF_L2 TaxID=3369421 RepID=UPI003F5E49CF